MEKAKVDDRIFLLTPDMGFSVFESFMETYPDRFLNTGIAEQNAMGIATGLAFSGFKPFVYSIGPFVLMRCYEQIRLGAAYMQANIKIVGVGGGVAYGPQGATHHIIEDFAIAKVLPNMIVCAPADRIEARQIFEQSIQIESPMYIRLARNNEPLIHKPDDTINIGKAFSLHKGDDIEIITTGTLTYRATEWLPEFKKQGISVGLTIFHTIKPLDTDCLDKLIETKKNVLVLEEHNIIGGLGESICAYMKQKDALNKVRILGIPDKYSHYVGTQSYILDKMGLWSVPDIEKLFN
jgi:transketolase